MLVSALLPLLVLHEQVTASPTPQLRPLIFKRKVCGSQPDHRLHAPYLSPSVAAVVSNPTASAPTSVSSAHSAALGVSPFNVSLSLGLGHSPSSAINPAPSASVPIPTPLVNKHVFAHFMVGIVPTYTAAAWEYDITLAKEAGITGFALNIGVDPYNEAQLDLAYAAGEKLGFDMFISFDFNWFGLGDYDKVVQLLKRYAGKKSQLLVDGKVFVSTFIGDGFDWSRVSQGVGRELYSVPFYQPNAGTAGGMGTSGLFSWAAWPGQLDNQPIKQNMTLDRDLAYLSALESAGKTYMAPISPWFSTHFGPEVPYAKNWVFYSEMLWKTRWDQILEMGNKVNFIEIVTWNDYGESHHIGPYKETPHTDDGSSRWNEGLDHTAMLDMAVPYITAFKAGLTKPVITQDMLVYWYRPHLKGAQCDSTDNCGSRPNGWDVSACSFTPRDANCFGGTATVTSGSNPPFTHTVEAGSQAFSVPMGVGQQHFSFKTNGGGNGKSTSTVDISDKCRGELAYL